MKLIRNPIRICGSRVNLQILKKTKERESLKKNSETLFQRHCVTELHTEISLILSGSTAEH